MQFNIVDNKVIFSREIVEPTFEEFTRDKLEKIINKLNQNANAINDIYLLISSTPI